MQQIMEEPLYNNANTTIQFNRITGNTATQGNQIYNDQNGTINATLNWWGTNTPNTNRNDIINNDGTCTYNPWIILTIKANPTTINTGGNSTITADLLHDNNGRYHDPANGLVPYNGLVNFSTTLGTINNSNMINGIAQSTLNAGTNLGTANITSTIDDDNNIHPNKHRKPHQHH